MALHNLILPKMGESVAEATIIKWNKALGDRVEMDDAIMDIATDKVDSEVPSPVAGKLVKQLFKENDVVQVGSVIAVIETADVAASSPVNSPAPAQPQNGYSSRPSEQLVQQQPVQQSRPAQTQPQNGYSGRPSEQLAQPQASRPAQPQPQNGYSTTQAAPQTQYTPPGVDQLSQRSQPVQTAQPSAGRFYSPLVKNIAIQEKVSPQELDSIPGTGSDGRLTKDDLLSYIKNRSTRPAVQQAPPVQQAPAPRPQPAAQPVATQQNGSYQNGTPQQAAVPQQRVQQEAAPQTPVSQPRVQQPAPQPPVQQPVSQQVPPSAPVQQPLVQQIPQQRVQQAPMPSPYATQQPAPEQYQPQPQYVPQPPVQQQYVPQQPAPQQYAPQQPPVQQYMQPPVQQVYIQQPQYTPQQPMQQPYMQPQYLQQYPQPQYVQQPYLQQPQYIQQQPQQYAPQQPVQQPYVQQPTPIQQPVAAQQPAPVQQPEPVKQPEAIATPEVKAPVYNAEDELIEMDRMRKMIAEHMLMSVKTSPHVTSFVEADVTNMVVWRERVKNAFEQREKNKLTFTPLFIEAVAKAIKDMPMINVSVNGTTIIKKKDINIGMATALPSGNLIVPVIRRADMLNLSGITRAVNDLSARARINKLSPDEVKDGTFTITNVGSFGNVMGTPIINQPQVAIMAVGIIKKKPAVISTSEGDIIGIRHMMYLSLSYDHRVVDGALGGSFLRRVADYLENWDINRPF